MSASRRSEIANADDGIDDVGECCWVKVGDEGTPWRKAAVRQCRRPSARSTTWKTPLDSSARRQLMTRYSAPVTHARKDACRAFNLAAAACSRDRWRHRPPAPSPLSHERAREDARDEQGDEELDGGSERCAGTTSRLRWNAIIQKVETHTQNRNLLCFDNASFLSMITTKKKKDCENSKSKRSSHI